MDTQTEPTTGQRPTGRFDYVQYDDAAYAHQETLKGMVTVLEKEINARIVSGRARALALTKLEEVYMWIGKGIRDDQVERNANTRLQEQRTDS